MIFRKDNRDESVQRQVSNRRKQPDTEPDTKTGDYAHEEPQETSQFATRPAPPPEEPPAPSRPTEHGPVPTPNPFANPASSATQSHRPTWQVADAHTSVIAANARWNGVLESDGSVHIHGRADGELHADQDVYVSDSAEVDAELHANAVIVAGTVRGRIDARGRLEVLPKGHVSGDVVAPKLVVHEGARISGQLQMDSGSESTAASHSTSTPATTRKAGQ